MAGQAKSLPSAIFRDSNKIANYYTQFSRSADSVFTSAGYLSLVMTALVGVSLKRPAGASWGLRLQGGADFDKALVISKVVESSASATCG